MPLPSLNATKQPWMIGAGWLAANILSYGVGFPVGFALGGTLLWGWVCAGLALAVLHWLILRGSLSDPVWFAAAGAAGLSAGVILGFFLADLAFRAWGLAPAFLTIGALAGLGVGLGQWLSIRNQYPLAGWLIPANSLGYSLALLAGWNVPEIIPLPRASIFGPEFGISIGLVVGIITGGVLPWILGKPMPNQPVPEKLMQDIRKGGFDDEV